MIRKRGKQNESMGNNKMFVPQESEDYFASFSEL